MLYLPRLCAASEGRSGVIRQVWDAGSGVV
jgi:hypothetical protein